ncbi:DUF362 domain-containing protein [Candidatus Uhrbacteria bacterium]|jgi:uncharacterized protein (DUF362 family)|nr:DUF362 domain-containing protein [Candidatus Uhrbacteria bacterium]
MIDVILESGQDRRKLVRKAVDALGDDFFGLVRDAQRILIKVNLVDHERQLACTHVDAVRGLLDVLKIYSPGQILVGDAGYRGTISAWQRFGYENLLREYKQVELVNLNDDEVVDGWTVKRDGTRNPIRRSKLAHEVDLRISLTPMKIDAVTGASLSIQNWTVGTWVTPSRVSATGRVWARWPWLDEEGSTAHHKSIAELYKQLPCDVAIVDGVLAMEGDGPVRGTAVQSGIVLAGMDALAVDAVGATLMGLDPSHIGYLHFSHEEGLGSINMSRINVPPMVMSQSARAFDRPLGFDANMRTWREEEESLV